ncbi:MAG: Ig-like domain-containing protein [Anaeromyxobacteraceae bacterium]
MSRMTRAAAVLLTIALASAAQADLNRVGPTALPSPPQNGFPAWYQDLNGTVLDLCIPDSADPGGLQAAACLLTPGGGIPTPPYVFPTNYPDEIFLFRATSDVATSAATRAVLVLALEGAFGTGAAAPGAQITFTRIRVTAGVPFDGTYTVNHPYGSETFPNVVAAGGNRDINFTEDIGIGAPGDFTGALTSRVGPFLMPSATSGGAASAPLTLNGAQFIGDGLTLSSITGAPFANWFEICGPFDGPTSADRCIRQPLFTMTGRLHNFATDPIGSPLTVHRATYARDATGATAQLDVNATAIPGIGQGAAKLTVAAPGVSSVLMLGPSTPALGDFYAQGIPVPPTSVPSVVTVINSGDAPPSSITHHVVDEVRVTQADWNPAAGTLTVVATSSDKFASGVPAATPALRLDGFLTATQLPGGIAGDPASVTITASAVLVPPPSVTVSSSAGGQGFSPVSMGLAAPFPCGVPFTQDDSVVTLQGAPVVISVLANDSFGAACPLTAPGLPVILAPGPTSGTAVVNADGTITFTSSLTGTASFRYTLADAQGTSNVGTVTVTVNTNPAGAVPIAVADGPFTVQVGSPLVILATALTGNDIANGGTLNPASIQIVAGSVTGGTATVAANGNVTFTAGATAGNFGFSYTVANTAVAPAVPQRSAPASVSMTVVAAGDQLTIASARYRANQQRWIVSGTSTVNAGNQVTITLFRGGTRIGVVGTVPVVLGAWSLDQPRSTVVAQNGDVVVATSAAGGTATLAVQIK